MHIINQPQCSKNLVRTSVVKKKCNKKQIRKRFNAFNYRLTKGCCFQNNNNLTNNIKQKPQKNKSTKLQNM